MSEKSKGKVYIVGAGPGSSGLITVRGLQVLRQADCVIYDRLIGGELLSVVPKNSKLIYVGKGHKSHHPEQKDINRLLVENSSRFKTVVRLKGGDPLIFGRASEELKCLTDNNIDFEIVPGITAASAAAACAGIVLTDRNTASTMTYVAAQKAGGKPIDIDFKSLVRLSGTIVFYMAVGNMKQICRRLIEAGLDVKTNVYVVANASLAEQKIIAGDVSNITTKCKKEGLKPPAVLIVGKNCSSQLKNNPLFGKKVLLTRDEVGNTELASKLAACGAEPISLPTFKIQDLTSRKPFKQILGKIKNFNWVFFTSPTGVRLFFKAVEKIGRDVRIFTSVKIACLGMETANELKLFGIKADFVPKIFTSEELAKNFIKKYRPINKNILLLRSALADLELAEKLKSSKAKITQISVYTSRKIRSNLKRTIKSGIDWIIFASSFAVESFFEDFKYESMNKKTKIASIGPKTSETLKKFGIKPTVEAKEHTIDGITRAMEEVK